jgi:hypothetical protein
MLSGKTLYKVIVLVILILRTTQIDIKSWPHKWGQGKLGDHMKSKEEKGEIMVFRNEFIIIGCFLYVNVCVN